SGIGDLLCYTQKVIRADMKRLSQSTKVLQSRLACSRLKMGNLGRFQRSAFRQFGLHHNLAFPAALSLSLNSSQGRRERLQGGVVKAPASVDIPYPDRDMSNHELLPKGAAEANVLPRTTGCSVSGSRSVIPWGAENSDQGIRKILHRRHDQIRLMR